MCKKEAAEIETSRAMLCYALQMGYSTAPAKQPTQLTKTPQQTERSFQETNKYNEEAKTTTSKAFKTKSFPPIKLVYQEKNLHT